MSIATLEGRVRDRINARRLQSDLIQRGADWNKVCSALDVIGDTELGLSAYLSHPPMEDPGLCYLHVYGALQILQTQQDAVDQVCRALNIKPQSSPKIPGIRELRSSAVGHPPAQRDDHVTKSNFIVRSSLSQKSFSLMTVFSDERQFVQRHVDIPLLVEQQRAVLANTLTEVIHILDEAEMKHRDQFKEEKLADCFPAALSYYFSKIFEALHSGQYFPLGKMHVELVAECLTNLRKMLESRCEWGIYDSINYEYELLEYPLAELKLFFMNRQDSNFNERDMYIFCAFVQQQIKELQQIASELDEKYASPPGNG